MSSLRGKFRIAKWDRLFAIPVEDRTVKNYDMVFDEGARIALMLLLEEAEKKEFPLPTRGYAMRMDDLRAIVAELLNEGKE